MTDHPYKNLPKTQFWSSGVTLPVNSRDALEIDPLFNSLDKNKPIVSGGSCFAQYIGNELISRQFDYLRSTLSGERTESFGLGNIYTIAQLKQWLEYSLGNRVWAENSVYGQDNEWYDLLLPHRGAMSSRGELLQFREKIRDELLDHLKAAHVFIFTIGLTETWKNRNGDILPSCPGTLVGIFDELEHTFHNSTFDEIYSDLSAVEALLSQINSEITCIYTVSPVPLTATASDSHVLLATTYSKSVLRAAVGQYCNHSKRASYFPSYELINHHIEDDWRLRDNLRSISKQGVRYVMGHAFGEDHRLPGSNKHTSNSSEIKHVDEAVCEEELLDSYSRLVDSSQIKSDILLVGDCHMEKLASGFNTAGVDVIGGIVMHGSSFTDYKYELSADKIFLPLDSKESLDIWLNIHAKMKSMNGCCHIICNIGFHTHKTINIISNHYNTLVLSEENIANYFEEYYQSQIHILRELTSYGKVWMVEDPDFHAFLGGKDVSQVVRAKNFHQYTNHMRKIAHKLDIEYLNPCDEALQRMFKDAKKLPDMISPEGFLGTQAYYDYCAVVVNGLIGNESRVSALAA